MGKATQLGRSFCRTDRANVTSIAKRQANRPAAPQAADHAERAKERAREGQCQRATERERERESVSANRSRTMRRVGAAAQNQFNNCQESLAQPRSLSLSFYSSLPLSGLNLSAGKTRVHCSCCAIKQRKICTLPTCFVTSFSKPFRTSRVISVSVNGSGLVGLA